MRLIRKMKLFVLDYPDDRNEIKTSVTGGVSFSSLPIERKKKAHDRDDNRSSSH